MSFFETANQGKQADIEKRLPASPTPAVSPQTQASLDGAPYLHYRIRSIAPSQRNKAELKSEILPQRHGNDGGKKNPDTTMAANNLSGMEASMGRINRSSWIRLDLGPHLRRWVF